MLLFQSYSKLFHIKYISVIKFARMSTNDLLLFIYSFNLLFLLYWESPHWSTISKYPNLSWVHFRNWNDIQHNFREMWSSVHWCQVSVRCTWFTGFTFRSRRWLVRLLVPVLGHWSLSHCIWWSVCFEVLPNGVVSWQLSLGTALGNSHMKRYSLPTTCMFLCINSQCMQACSLTVYLSL